jgi:large subunit ribosomal protein L13
MILMPCPWCGPRNVQEFAYEGEVAERPEATPAPQATLTALEERQMPTYSPSAKDITRDWYVVDAEGQTLGRLATRVATVLRGKHKPTFTPHMDMGDHVIVVNADKIVLTGAKSEQKLYHSHSGFPGGIKSVPFAAMLEKQPTKVVEKAIKGMLPHNRLGRKMATKLKVYAGPEHPHQAQKPTPYEIGQLAQ